MKFSELLSLILNSHPQQWTHVSGNPLHQTILPSTNGQGELVDLGVKEHYSQHGFKDDLSIVIAQGLSCVETFKEKWTEHFSDPSASSSFVDVFFNGMVVFRTTVAHVDGGAPG